MVDQRDLHHPGAVGERDGYAYAPPLADRPPVAGSRSPVAPEPVDDDVRQPVGRPARAFAGS
ncbi:hypothetical protein ABZ250_37415 [Streptomyces afghaniensis]|uniref:hypothetical protein n=1 Tax=Streptomyces afghaniensis TaxID=66865 RepID=UPI0033B26733